MMNDSDELFAEVARECGLGVEYFGDGYNYSPVHSSYDAQQIAYTDQFSELADDVEYSSPSPSERRVALQTDSHIFQFDNRCNDKDATQLRCQRRPQYGVPVTYPSPILRSVPFQDFYTPRTAQFGDSHYRYKHNHEPPLLPTSIDSLQSYDTQHNLIVASSPQHRNHSTPHNSANEFQTPGIQPGYIRGSNPRNSNRTRLRPVSELPDRYRGIFKFGVFNAVQSICFDEVLHSDKNLVISAPTGSGKTVLFELAIIRMLIKAPTTQNPKCVYMAPTKALCFERYRDWAAKFDALGVKCCELTGDTVQFGRGAWGDAKTASIIITTGEKWDSLTRNWGEHNRILSQIQLFLVDEVHILNESRGSTLEVVISRMKTRGSSIRFALVSATVPNIEDIASWIGCVNSNGPAAVFQFGEEFRPCKLTRFVYGIHRPKNQNDFVFARSLDYHLYALLVQHSAKKPVLIFVSTRKGAFVAAEQLAKEYREASDKKQSLPWSQPSRIDRIFNEKRLNDLATCGIGVHHAGLSIDDRRAVEDLYLKGVLKVVAATSTLAVGVNLPAHTVVIKGVHTFQNNVSVEYSDLDVVQMLGRAGRPQFDNDGVAIILCENELEHKYKSLVQGKTILESSLHLNLSEHLNSEIGLGTITDVNSAKEWLRNSFLFRRIQKNPNHYALRKEDNQSWEERIDELVMQSVANLQKTELVMYTTEGDAGLRSTDYGDIMSKFYIRLSTMSLIIALPPRASMREMLEMISASEELADTKLRSSEKRIYNALRKHNDIRFELKKVEKTSDKIFLLIQAVLGGISLNAPEYQSVDSQPQLDVFNIFRHLSRIARAMVEVAVVKKLGSQLKHCMELLRCFTAKAWEDRPVVLRQIEQIGEKSLKILAGSGVTSIDLLRKQDPLRIETLLNRRPPFGLEVIASACDLPTYFLNVTETEISSSGGKNPVEVVLSVECGLATAPSTNSRAKNPKSRLFNMTAVLILRSDMDFIDFRRIPTKALATPKTFEVTAQLTKPSQSILVYIASESIAGVTITCLHKPNLDPKEYPTMDTRPINSIDIDIQGLENDPDFWNMNIDYTEDENITIKDLTKPERKPKEAPLPVPPTTISTNLPVIPKKLPNDNYPCNHRCKDKVKCRHLCCRDGTPAPDSKKRHTANWGSSKGKVVDHTEHPDVQSATKTSAIQADRRFRELESLHKRTNVQTNLKLAEGGRLKLESHAKLKAKATPNFDIELANINDDSVPIIDLDNLSDNDNLPEPSEILKPSTWTMSSETGYAHSDIDMLIRDLPMEECKNRNKPSLDTFDLGDDKLSLPSTPPVRLKRGRGTQDTNLARKRSKLQDQDDVITASSSPLPCFKGVDKFIGEARSNVSMALFLAESPAQNDHDDEDKTNLQKSSDLNGSAHNKHAKSADSSLDFEAFYRLATPAFGTSISAQGDVEKFPIPNLKQGNNDQRLLAKEDPRGDDTEIGQVVSFDDDLAEMEAWLLSGEVDVVSELS